MWQFAEACRGLKDACLQLGIPVTGGNVSLYNQTGETALPPRWCRARRHRGRHPAHPSGFEAEGDEVFLLGADPRRALRLRVGARRARPPRRAAAAGGPGRGEGAGLAPGRGRRAAELCPRPVRRRPRGGPRGVRLHRGIGCTVSLEGDAFVGAVRRATARAIVTTRDAAALTELAARHGVPLTRLGTTGGTDLVVEGQFSVPVEEVRAAWAATLPTALG